MTKKRKTRVVLDETTKAKALRDTSTYTVEAVAKQYGVSKATVSRWKKEQRASKGLKRKKTGELAGTDAASERRDVMAFLEMAEKAILRSGARRVTAGESYALLALTTLRDGG